MHIKFMVKLIVFVCFLIGCANLNGQDCFEYHISECEPDYDGYKLSSQSRSALFKLGHSSSFSFRAMEGYEYLVTMCYEEKLHGIALTVFDVNKNYSYSIEQGDRFVHLVIEESTDLEVKVDVPLGDVEIEKVPYEELYGCVGVRIEYKRNID